MASTVDSNPAVPTRLIRTQPHEGQKPGTSGLRKKVSVPPSLPFICALLHWSDRQRANTESWRGYVLQVTEFQKPHYLENFVQATFNALPAGELKGALRAL